MTTLLIVYGFIAVAVLAYWLHGSEDRVRKAIHQRSVDFAVAKICKEGGITHMRDMGIEEARLEVFTEKLLKKNGLTRDEVNFWIDSPGRYANSKKEVNIAITEVIEFREECIWHDKYLEERKQIEAEALKKEQRDRLILNTPYVFYHHENKQ